MRSFTKAAFCMLLAATLFILLGWILPFWFSRGQDTNNGVYWNIFYGVACILDNCASDSSIIKESNVFTIFGAETGVQLEAIAVMAILAFIFCILSVILALIFQFGACGVRSSYYFVILGALFCMAISALLDLVTVIIAAVALDDFFEPRKIQNAFEFPWSVLLFSIGGVAMSIAAIMYAYILNHWKRYRHIYSRERYYFETMDSPDPIYSIDARPDYRKDRFMRRDSLRRSYAPPRDYARDDYFDDYRRGVREDYQDYYRKSTRPTDRRYPREYRKPYNYYDRYREESRYSTPRYGASRYDRPWHGKLDDVIGEAHRLRMTSGNRWRDRDPYYY